MVARRNDFVDPALFPGRAHARYRGVQVLGDRSGKVGVAGVAARTQVWRLDKTELKDIQGIQAEIAREELREEQAKGNLIDSNLFVDGSQFKTESQVKLYGTITYDDVASLADMMLYITKQLYDEYTKYKLVDKDVMRRSARWVHNSVDVRPDGVPILDRGDQLVVYGDVPYAKYHESGTKTGTIARHVYRKVAARAKRRFGRGFIVEHKFLQVGEIATMRKVRKFKLRRGKLVSYKAYPRKYYKRRWAISFPAIKITQRQGVKFRVQ